MTEKELLKLKEEIESTSEEVTKLETRKEVLMEKLEKDFGCKSLKAAKKKVDTLESEIKELDGQIDTATEELEKQLEDA